MFWWLSEMLFRKQIDINKLSSFQLFVMCNAKAGISEESFNLILNGKNCDTAVKM